MTTKAKSRGNKDEKLREGIFISVADLRVGHKIVVRWHGKKIGDGPRDLTLEEVAEILKEGEDGTRYVAKSVLVKEIKECPSQWRTHIHVGSACYDTRQRVWIEKDA